jgi:peroxiredoxin
MKRIITSLLIFCPVILMAQAGFTIKGKIVGPLAMQKKIYLSYNDGEKFTVIDSAAVKRGEFEISGIMKDDEYNQARLSIGKAPMEGSKLENQLTLFPKKGDRITIDIKGALNTAKITGSKQSEVYRWVQDSLAHTKDVNQQLVIFKEMIAQYPDSKMVFTAFAARFGSSLSKSYPDQLPEILRLYAQFSPRIQNTKEVALCGKSIEDISHLIVGGILPDFTAKTPEGKEIKLSELRGKYVLVDFWASWCIPCRTEFPHLKKAYARFKDKNFEILGYSIDNEKSLWVSALENDDVPWLNVSNLQGMEDPTKLKYQIYGVPANFLIGPDGKVIAINLRGELVEPSLAKFIK